MERKFSDFSFPGSECSTERKFHGSESSLCGLFAPGNESAEERKVQIAPQFGLSLNQKNHRAWAVTLKNADNVDTANAQRKIQLCSTGNYIWFKMDVSLAAQISCSLHCSEIQMMLHIAPSQL